MQRDAEPLGFSERVVHAAGLSLWFVFVYTSTNYLTTLRESVPTAAFFWERYIPFVPAFIIPYWSIDIFFVAASFVVQSRSELHLFRRRIFWGIALAGVCFLCFPLRLVFERPQVAGFYQGFFDALDQMYNFHNLAPSLHIVLRTILWTVYAFHGPRWWRRFIQIWFFLIGISTLLCWQHQVIDIFSGQLLGLLLIHLLFEKKQESSLSERVNANASYGFRYAILSGAFLVLAFLTPLWGLIFLWPAASLLAVSLAYAGLGPEVFRKSGGILPSGSRLLFLPYLSGLYLSFRYYTARAPAWSEVNDSFILGRALSEEEASELIAIGVTRVVDLTAEWTEPKALRSLDYLSVPVLDLTLPSREQFEQVSAFLNENTDAKTYIHCSLGFSRSSLCVLHALSSRKGSLPLEENHARLQQCRSGIVLSEEKLRYLKAILATSRAEHSSSPKIS